MCLIAVSTDLGGIVRTRSTVDAPTPRCWELKASGRKLLDLEFWLDLFNVVVAENELLLDFPEHLDQRSLAGTPRPEPVETLQARGFDLSSVERTHDAARRDGGKPADAVIIRLPPAREGLNSTHLRLLCADCILSGSYATPKG